MKPYCSRVWTQAMRCLRILSTISKTERALNILAQRRPSIIVPKVPVLPIPALQ